MRLDKSLTIIDFYVFEANKPVTTKRAFTLS